MTNSVENNHEELVQDLAKSLQATSALMQSLLSEIRQNSTTLAVLKEKLESLRENVNTLSEIVRSGNGRGSLITRLALVEQSLGTLEEQIDEYSREVLEALKLEKETERNKSLGKLKVVAVAIPGIVSLIIIMIKLFMSEYSC